MPALGPSKQETSSIVHDATCHIARPVAVAIAVAAEARLGRGHGVPLIGRVT